MSLFAPLDQPVHRRRELPRKSRILAQKALGLGDDRELVLPRLGDAVRTLDQRPEGVDPLDQARAQRPSNSLASAPSVNSERRSGKASSGRSTCDLGRRRLEQAVVDRRQLDLRLLLRQVGGDLLAERGGRGLLARVLVEAATASRCGATRRSSKSMTRMPGATRRWVAMLVAGELVAAAAPFAPRSPAGSRSARRARAGCAQAIDRGLDRPRARRDGCSLCLKVLEGSARASSTSPAIDAETSRS